MKRLLICLFLFLFSFSCAFAAENKYAGKRWGFSHMVSTPGCDFAWSKDGRHLSFRVVRNDISYIYRIRDIWKVIEGKTLPGKLKTELVYTIHSPVKFFKFSPDLTKAAYSVSEGGGYALYCVTFAVQKTKRLTFGMAPEWSPKGDKIAFYFMGNNGNYGIGIINPDGTALKVLSALGDWNPVWSPDGKSLAFTSSREYSKGTTEYSNIYVMRLSPLSIMQVTKDKNAYHKNVKWSPVGRKLVYETFRGIEIVDVPPNKRKLIVNAGEYPVGHSFKPFFSPDGRWIFYRKEKGMGIYQHNTQEEVVIGGSNAWWDTVLAPYGEKIVFSILGSGSQSGIWVVEAFDY
ncbi:MAG: hypothetical protein MJ234_04050 [bacterium]|nr:hypothetical protein [bacterium]